jgi:hypothetical protein
MSHQRKRVVLGLLLIPVSAVALVSFYFSRAERSYRYQRICLTLWMINYDGRVVKAVNGEPIPGANILIRNRNSPDDLCSGASAYYTEARLISDQYGRFEGGLSNYSGRGFDIYIAVDGCTPYKSSTNGNLQGEEGYYRLECEN